MVILALFWACRAANFKIASRAPSMEANPRLNAGGVQLVQAQAHVFMAGPQIRCARARTQLQCSALVHRTLQPQMLSISDDTFCRSYHNIKVKYEPARQVR
jgi:hypothetical protein